MSARVMKILIHHVGDDNKHIFEVWRRYPTKWGSNSKNKYFWAKYRSSMEDDSENICASVKILKTYDAVDDNKHIFEVWSWFLKI